MNVLHFADAHANANKDAFLKSLNQIRQYLLQNDIGLITFSGDLFDSKIFASGDYIEIIEKFSELADHAPIVMVYGTPSHDYKHSLDTLRNLRTEFAIKVVDKIKRSYLVYNKHFYNLDEKFSKQRDDVVLVHPLPWLSKHLLLTDDELLNETFKNQNILFEKRIKKWSKERKEINKELKYPSVLVAHLQLAECIPSFGQDMHSDNHKSEWFDGVCDYGALGHIHKAQKIGKLYYAGSMYNKTWGETELKFFNVYNTQTREVKQIQFDTPLLRKDEICGIDEYKKLKSLAETPKRFYKKLNLTDEQFIFNLWLNLNLENKNLINVEQEKKFWYDQFNNLQELRVDVSQIKTDVVKRLNDYNSSMPLTEKFIVWCENKKIKYNDFHLEKIKELENVG